MRKWFLKTFQQLLIKNGKTAMLWSAFHMPYIHWTNWRWTQRWSLHSLVSAVHIAQQTFPVISCSIYQRRTHVSKTSHELLLTSNGLVDKRSRWKSKNNFKLWKRTEPAKHKPALLQVTAVIIIWHPSREWIKFGGKAVLCLLTTTCQNQIPQTFFWE